MLHTKLPNVGTCFLCNQKFESRFITNHLKKCSVKNNTLETDEKEKTFLIQISDGKLFWLYIEMTGSATLDDLDIFLRDIWLECCGHLSAFIINGQEYASDESLNKKIHRLLELGTQFKYVYDFGSTTELKGKIISIRQGKTPNKINLLARNSLPNLQCSIYENEPTVICSICYDFLCKKCIKKHKTCEDIDYMLPVTNSPRMGVCGYTGPLD